MCSFFIYIHFYCFLPIKKKKNGWACCTKLRNSFLIEKKKKFLKTEDSLGKENPIISLLEITNPSKEQGVIEEIDGAITPIRAGGLGLVPRDAYRGGILHCGRQA